MMNKTNKFISIILIVAMLLGITWITSYADSGTITLVCPDRDELLENTKVRLGIEVEGVDTVAYYKLFSSVGGDSYVEESQCDADALYATATIKSTPRYYIVKAYDASGTELAVSNAVILSGKRAKVRKSIWDVDFDTGNISVIANGNDRYLSEDGVNALKPNGDSMGMHVGDADNTITVESSSEIESGINGKSLVFTTNGNAGTCQINSGWAKISSGIAVYSVDVATTNYASKTLLTGASAKATGGNQWMTTVETRPDGRMLMYLRSQDAALRAPGVTKITSGADAGYTLVGTYETNKWYNVKFVMNIEAGTLDVYINDTYIATDYERVSPTITPARFQISNGSSDGSLYVDNIRAYTVEHITVNPGLSIDCDAKDYSLPEGTKVKIDVTAIDMEEMSRIDLLKSTNDEEYSVVSSFSDSSASTTIMLTREACSYKAVAYDSNDAIIMESELLDLSASPVVMNETLWDIDFENEKFNASAEYRYLCDETGTALTMSHSAASSSLTAHTGSMQNDITIEDSGDASHGKAVKLIANDEKQVQFNEFRSRTTGGTVVAEWDIKFDSLPQNSSSLLAYLMDVEVAPDGTGAKKYACGVISLRYDGSTPCFSYLDGGDTRYHKEIVVGEWYNIKSYTDLDNGVITMLIDDEFAFQREIDSSYTWIEKYVLRFGNASGCEVWADNFKVQKASVIPVPKVNNITNDENSLYIEFAHEIDDDVFYNYRDEICNIKVEYDGDKLDIISCETTDNPKILKFTAEKKIYTSVSLDIEITVPYGDGDVMKCNVVYDVPPLEFDVTDVNARYNGSDFSIEAVLCNESESEKTVVMVAVFYDGDGNIVAVKPSAPVENIKTGTRIVLSGTVEAEKMNVFFIDNWQSSKAVKNVVYKR